MDTLAPNHGQNSVRGVPLRSASPITSSPWVSTWSCRAVDLLSGDPEESVIVDLPVQTCWGDGRQGARGRQSRIARTTRPMTSEDHSRPALPCTGWRADEESERLSPPRFYGRAKDGGVRGAGFEVCLRSGAVRVCGHPGGRLLGRRRRERTGFRTAVRPRAGRSAEERRIHACATVSDGAPGNGA